MHVPPKCTELQLLELLVKELARNGDEEEKLQAVCIMDMWHCTLCQPSSDKGKEEASDSAEEEGAELIQCSHCLWWYHRTCWNKTQCGNGANAVAPKGQVSGKWYCRDACDPKMLLSTTGQAQAAWGIFDDDMKDVPKTNMRMAILEKRKDPQHHVDDQLRNGRLRVAYKHLHPFDVIPSGARGEQGAQ